MMRRLVISMAVVLLAACSSEAPRPTEDGRTGKPVAAEGTNGAPPAPTGKAEARKPPVVQKRGGGYYQDDGPGDNAPADLAAIPDAVPKVEPPHRFANNPYSVLGTDYVLKKSATGYRARGVASWYGRKFHGQKTSSGEPYDMFGMTAAHPTLPIPSYVRVTNPANGKSVIVRINDRGPFHAGRLIDLSYTAAWKLDYIGEGSTLVIVEAVQPGGGETTPVTAVVEAPVKPVASPILATLPTVAVAGRQYIQLGAFSNLGNAQALQAHLARELGDMADKLVINSAGNLHRVQLGPWPDVASARRAAQVLTDTFGVKTTLAISSSPASPQ